MTETKITVWNDFCERFCANLRKGLESGKIVLRPVRYDYSKPDRPHLIVEPVLKEK